VRVHKPGYVEAELQRIAINPPHDHRHSLSVFAEALLILLDRTEPAAPKSRRGRAR
jgi:hypothetical protein